MTKLINERVVPLSEARNLFPRPVSQATVELWVRQGVRGVTLESFFCGRKRYTSEEAIQRFIEKQNPERKELDT